jgi:hypothetical protein
VKGADELDRHVTKRADHMTQVIQGAAKAFGARQAIGGVVSEEMARASAAAARERAKAEAEAQRVRNAERAALYEISTLNSRLTKSKWAAERDAARNEHNKQMAELAELARKGEDVRNRTRAADLQYAAQVKQISTDQARDQAARMRNVGLGMSATVTPALGLFGRESIKGAMDAIEIQNKFDVAFKSSARSAEQWAQSFSKSVGGLDVALLRDRAASFQLLFNAMNMSRGQAEKMSTSLTQLAYDLSSLYNTSIEEAFVRLQSGLVGETEAVRRFGVDVSEAALKEEARRQGIQKNVDQMSQSEKVMLRYGMIMRQTTDAQGDLARTQGSAANQSRLAQEAFTNAQRELGERLIPMYVAGARVVRGLANAFAATGSANQTVIAGLGLLAFSAGPVITAYAQLTIALRTKAIAQKMATIAIIEENGALKLNAIATEQNAAAQAGFIAKARAFAVANPVAIALGAASVAAMALIGYYQSLESHVDRLAKKAHDLPKFIERDNASTYAKALSSASDENLRIRQKNVQEQIRANQAQLDAYKKRQRWGELENPLAHVDVVATESELKDQVAREQAIADEIDRRKTVEKQLSDEAKKALAANEEANRTALQEKYILSARTEKEKVIRQAWVELSNSKAEIVKTAKEAKDKFGIILDTAAQLKTAQYAYDQAIKEQNAKAAETVLDQQAAARVAQLNLDALRATNEYTSQRLQVEADRTAKLRALAKEKASQVEIQSANIEADKKLEEIGRQEAIAALNDEIAREKAQAIRADDKGWQAELDNAQSFITSAFELKKRYGEAFRQTGEFEKIKADFYGRRSQIAKEAADKAREEREKRFDQAFSLQSAATENAALRFEATGSAGDMVKAAKDRARGTRDVELDALRKSTAPLEEQFKLRENIFLRYAAAIKKIDQDAAEDRKRRDQEQAQSVIARVQQVREEENERRRAFEEERKRRYDAAGQFGRAEDIWRDMASAGMKSRYATDYLQYIQPNEPMTDREIKQANWDLVASNERQEAQLERIIAALRPAVAGGR